MNSIDKILKDLRGGKITAAAAKKAIASAAIVNLSHTRVDLQRRLRTGAGEVIYGAGKTPEQITEIASALVKNGEDVLLTRASDAALALFKERFPKAEISECARAASLKFSRRALTKSFIAIVSAGTSDMRVSEEARVTAEFLGSRTQTFYDCGVAGLHRLAGAIEQIREAKVVVAVAGMEGALASVLAGLVKSPVIAVPTSVGYGASFGGLAALLAMLNSCANGVSVVNIDNGFGAAYNAHLINSL